MFYAADALEATGTVIVEAINDTDYILVGLLHLSRRQRQYRMIMDVQPTKYVDLSALSEALTRLVPVPDPCCSIAAVYAASGCDYLEGTARYNSVQSAFMGFLFCC